jgi:acyl dehydratase
MTVPLIEMEQLVGAQFPGGTFTVEPWENFLLHEVFGAGSPPDGLAHPMYAFHAPLAGMGMSYADLFAMCRAESSDAVRAGTYDFEYLKPLLEGATYTIRGEITGVERKRGARAGLFDMVTFRLDMVDEAGEVAVVASNSWLFLRSE